MTKNTNHDIILEMRNIVKQFPKVLANDNVSINLRRGEILALLGENGAGKSTLMNILYGLYKPTSGEILLEGKKVELKSPKDAIKLGLGMVHQHFMLVENFTATENIILGNEPGKYDFLDQKAAKNEVLKFQEKYHLHFDPDLKIENMSVGLQQRVEIVKALYRKAKILILDEPTAVLTPQEVEELFDVIRNLRDSGVSIIIITHKLEEVKEISERVYVLRKGKVVGEKFTKDVTKEELANMMVGREVVLTVHKEPKQIKDQPLVKIENLFVKSDKNVYAIKDLSIDIKPGEIVGIAGVDGNGQTELAEAIMGLRKIEKGRVLINGKDIKHNSTKERIESGFSFVPADRQRFGLILPMKISENIVIGQHYKPPFANGINLNLKEIEKYSEMLIKQYDIRTPSSKVPAGNLSGGNQQKVILAREFSRNPKFLLIAQPTRGLDVGAIEYIHKQILKMRDLNVAILLISLELEEIFTLSDRILVLYEGEIVKELIPEKTTDKEVGFYMTGGKKEPVNE